MGLEIMNASDAQKWDEAVMSSPNGTLYHSWSWLKIAERHSGCKLFPLAFYYSGDEEPFGLLPLFYKEKMGIKMMFSPPPGSAVTLGPVLLIKDYKQHKSELAYIDFQSSVDRFIRRLGANYTLIVTSPGLLDIRPFSWAKYEVSPVYTYRIDLKPGLNAVWENLSKSLRTNIRNASKRGITVAESSGTEAVETLFNSVKQRYTRQHLKLPLEADYLKELFNKLGESLKLYLAMYNHEAVGASSCVVYRDTVTSWVGGARAESNNIEANELLTWCTIEKAIRGGYRWFEIEGGNTRHLCDSKSRYCPSVEIYFQIKKADLFGRLAENMYLIMKRAKIRS
jgi:hypothetical protein